MVKALAPKSRLGSYGTWLWIVTTTVLVGVAATVSAQVPDGKNAPKGSAPKSKEAPAGDAASKDATSKAAVKAAPGDPAGKAAPKAEDAKAEGDDEAAIASQNDSGEIFKDPQAQKALPNTFTQLAYPASRSSDLEIADVRKMAANLIGTDKAVLTRYIETMAAELTNHANIRALIEPPANLDPTSSAARAVIVNARKIERASMNLIEPLAIAKSSQNSAFLATYIPMLQAKLVPLLDNQFVARIQAMIVLGTAGSPASIDVFLKQLNDENQVVWVKLWAARGITNATQSGAQPLDTQKGLAVATTLLKVLASRDLPWPAELRILETIGANRLASTSPIDRKADVLSAIVTSLTDTQARLDVRAWSAWSAGMIQPGNQIAKLNYALVTYHVGKLVAEIGDKIGEEFDQADGKFDKRKGPATYMTGLLLYQLLPAFDGLPNVRSSGLINNSHPSAVANKPFAQGVETQLREVSKAALELIRAGGAVAQTAARKALAARVTELNSFLQKNKPTDVELIPGGVKFPIGPAQVAGGPAAK